MKENISIKEIFATVKSEFEISVQSKITDINSCLNKTKIKKIIDKFETKIETLVDEVKKELELIYPKKEITKKPERDFDKESQKKKRNK